MFMSSEKYPVKGPCKTVLRGSIKLNKKKVPVDIELSTPCGSIPIQIIVHDFKNPVIGEPSTYYEVNGYVPDMNGTNAFKLLFDTNSKRGTIEFLNVRHEPIDPSMILGQNEFEPHKCSTCDAMVTGPYRHCRECRPIVLDQMKEVRDIRRAAGGGGILPRYRDADKREKTRETKYGNSHH